MVSLIPSVVILAVQRNAYIMSILSMVQIIIIIVKIIAIIFVSWLEVSIKLVLHFHRHVYTSVTQYFVLWLARWLHATVLYFCSQLHLHVYKHFDLTKHYVLLFLYPKNQVNNVVIPLTFEQNVFQILDKSLGVAWFSIYFRVGFIMCPSE